MGSVRVSNVHFKVYGRLPFDELEEPQIQGPNSYSFEMKALEPQTPKPESK